MCTLHCTQLLLQILQKNAWRKHTRNTECKFVSIVKHMEGALHLHTAQILVDILYAGKHMDGACIAHCADTHATLCTVTHVEVACTPHCVVKHVQPEYCMHCTECQFCSKTCVGSIALSQRTECRFYSKTGSCRADHVVTWRVNEHCALNRFSWKF